MPMIVATPAVGPEWTRVLGGEVLFAPIDRAMMRRARRAALAALDREDEAGADERSPGDQLDELGDALSYQLIIAGAQDWRDVEQALPGENGETVFEPVAFSRELLLLALSDPITFDAFDAAYVVPYATRERERAAPGKGSPLSQDGTGTKAQAEQTIATSPAPASAADVTSAPTGSTKRKLTPKKTSGTS